MGEHVSLLDTVRVDSSGRVLEEINDNELVLAVEKDSEQMALSLIAAGSPLDTYEVVYGRTALIRAAKLNFIAKTPLSKHYLTKIQQQ